ncbi:MAG: peptidoglycan binding domain-containing protein [Hespellia sp.]|nr:peptidoglycan binding domain-containing protein [Hespellia sp.]
MSDEMNTEQLEQKIQRPKRRRRKKVVSDTPRDTNADSEQLTAEAVSDVIDDMEEGADVEKSEDAKPKKRRKKKVKKVEPETEEVPEEGGDSWLDDDDIDVLDDDSKQHKGRGLKIFLITLAAIFGTIAVAYLGFAIFFINHFYFYTTVNGMNFSLRSEKYVSSYIERQVADYELTVEEKGGVKETISGTDIDLKYVANDQIKDAIQSQNPFLWPKAFFVKSSAKVSVDVDYDKDKLQAQLDKLQSVTAPDQTDPVSAYPKYENGQYVIEPEVTGTKVDTARLSEEANKYVSGFKNDLNMEEDECYLMPAYTEESPEVIAARDTMNAYCKTEITYDMSPNTEVVNADLINTWLSYNESMQVSINEDSVGGYMADLASRYDTVGTTRSFTTPSGRAAEVSGGTYGWSIDQDAEKAALIASIQAGEVATRAPAYSQTGATHDAADWGSTYCEVDISAQHMWYVVNGSVALETDVVTGANYDNRSTPTGVYEILEKLSPTVLKGSNDPTTGKPKYETPVDYWMRVTWSGIGFHDATWQSAFGGSRYVNGHGSHGCINMPYSSAQNLYSMLEMGTPVIIHY